MNAILFAVDIWQTLTHLDYHHVGAFNHRAVPEIRDAKIEVAILVHRACLENDDVNWRKKAAVVVRHFTEVEGHIVAESGIVIPAVTTRKVPTKPEKALAP